MENDEIVLRGRVEKKSIVLSHPGLYTDTPMICFLIPRDYLPALTVYSEKVDLSNLELRLKPWPDDVTQRAKNFFFALRDRLAEETSGTSPVGEPDKEYKYHLYKSCLQECRFYHWIDGQKTQKLSIKDLNKKELWILTTKMKEMCEDAMCYMADLLPEYRYLHTNFKTEE